MRRYPQLNKVGQGSHDPWPELDEFRGVDMYRHTLGYEIVTQLVSVEARIIDLGCGDGILLGLLWGGGYFNLTGVDISEEGLDRALRKAPGLKTIQADLTEDLPLTETYDLVICSELLEHLPRDEDVASVMSLALRLLAPGGAALVTVPNDTICVVDADHRRLFTPGDHTQLLQDAGFTQVEEVRYHYSDKYPYPWMMATGRK